MHATDRSKLPVPTPDDPSCPTCHSVSVTTTAKVPDDNSYWRCERCGDVWNRRRHRIGRERQYGNRTVSARRP